jgi:hypothetical protein
MCRRFENPRLARRLPRAATGYAARVPSTKLLLTTGERVEIEGSKEEVTRALEDASRSTSGTLAWLRNADTGEDVGVNPTHVVMLTPSDG